MPGLEKLLAKPSDPDLGDYFKVRFTSESCDNIIANVNSLQPQQLFPDHPPPSMFSPSQAPYSSMMPSSSSRETSVHHNHPLHTIISCFISCISSLDTDYFTGYGSKSSGTKNLGHSGPSDFYQYSMQ